MGMMLQWSGGRLGNLTGNFPAYALCWHSWQCWKFDEFPNTGATTAWELQRKECNDFTHTYILVLFYFVL